MSFNRDSRGGGRSFGRRDFGGRGFDRNRDRGSSGGRGGDRPMYQATCSNCGKPCEVPFRPTSGKPVYCSDCFEKMGGGRRSDSPRPERSEYRAPSGCCDQCKVQLDAINTKLDRILRLLEPQVAPVVPAAASVSVGENVEKTGEVKEIKVPKAKKTTKKSASKKEKVVELPQV